MRCGSKIRFNVIELVQVLLNVGKLIAYSGTGIQQTFTVRGIFLGRWHIFYARGSLQSGIILVSELHLASLYCIYHPMFLRWLIESIIQSAPAVVLHVVQLKLTLIFLSN